MPVLDKQKQIKSGMLKELENEDQILHNPELMSLKLEQIFQQERQEEQNF